MVYFSIIIPVYNAQDKIKKCINSILAQTETDYEIVCVDDKSSDHTLNELRALEKQNEKIKVISLAENSGPVYARMLGFKVSSGKYIWYVDPDDYLNNNNSLKEIKSELEAYPVDIFNFNSALQFSRNCSEEERKNISDWIKPFSGNLEGSDIFIEEFCNNSFKHNLWNKVLSRQVLEKAYHYIGNDWICMSDDLYLMFLVSYFAQSFHGTDKITGYTYVFGGGVSCVNVMTDKKYIAYSNQGIIFDNLKRFLNTVHEKDRLYWDALKNHKQRILKDCIYVWYNYVEEQYSSNAFRKLVNIWRFDKVFNSLVYEYYDNFYSVINKIKDWQLPNSEPSDIKTIGVYYHRMYNGGVEKVISLLIPMWLKIGYDVVLITDEPQNVNDYNIPKKVQRVVIQHFKDTNNKNYIVRKKQWEDTIKDNQIDVVVYHAWNKPIMLWDMQVIKNAGAWFIVQTHLVFSSNLSWMGDGFKALNYLMGMADGVVTITKTDEVYWKNYNSNTVKISNPVDAALSSKKVVEINSNNIVWVGRFEDYKRPKDVFSIMQKVIEEVPDAKLYMLGKTENDEDMEEYELLRHQYNLDDTVFFEGFHSEISSYYKNAKVHLLTSEMEGFSMVLLESKAYGIPTVMYNLDYLDMVREKKGILIASIADTNQIADHIIKLLKDTKFWSEQSKMARLSFEEMRDENLAEKWHNLFMHIQTGKKYERTPDEEIIRTMIENLNKAKLLEKSIDVQNVSEQERQAQILCGEIIQSSSFKIGRAITWLPRKLRDILKKVV